MASLKDIARELGVSVSLVSKVLNNRLGTTGASQPMIEAIQSKATTLGYRKNVSALSLRRGRHDVIGVFVHKAGTSGSGLAEALLQGISVAANEAGQRQFLNFFAHVHEFNALCDAAHTGIMDGLIIAGVRHKELRDRLFTIQQSGVPVVTVYDRPIDENILNIGMNQVEVGRLATQHLIDRGCRHIAHIRNQDARFKGYKAALADSSIRYDSRRVFTVEEDCLGHKTGEDAVLAFIRSGLKFDGLVTQSDQEAMGAANALAKAGLEIPADVRIVGVDNSPYCEFARVPLTSVSQNFEERGTRAVVTLLRALDAKNTSSVEIAPTLKVRASTR